MMFGNDESIHCLAEVPLKGAKDEALCIAYKRSILFIVAGVRVKDEGYVLGILDKTSSPSAKADPAAIAGLEVKTYYPLPPGDVPGYQQHGMLPTPLPRYELPIWDYVFGYSLWLLVGGLVIFYGVQSLVSRSRAKPQSGVVTP